MPKTLNKVIFVVGVVDNGGEQSRGLRRPPEFNVDLRKSSAFESPPNQELDSTFEI